MIIHFKRRTVEGKEEEDAYQLEIERRQHNRCSICLEAIINPCQNTRLYVRNIKKKASLFLVKREAYS